MINQSTEPEDITSQSFSTPLTQPSKRLNKTLLAVISIIGVSIIGGGVFGYFYYFQSPEKIVQKMTARLIEIKSLEYSGEVKIEVDTGDSLGGTSNFSINFTGLSDIQKLDDPRSLFSFNIKTDALPQGEFAFGLEIRTIGKIAYVKLNDVPSLDFFDLSAVKNQWIKIDAEVLKKQFGLEKVEEQLKEAEKKQELSPEQIEKLKIAVKQAKIFKITEKLASEKIEGINTYHYKFTIDKEEIKKLFIDISQVITLTEKELADFDKSLETSELPEGEIWIGKKDLLPYKISLSSTIEETDKSKTSSKVSFTLWFKNFNKPVQIDIPAQVKPLEEVLEGLLLRPQVRVPARAL